MIGAITSALTSFYCEETLRDMNHYNIKLDGTIDNGELLALANTIASTYTKPFGRMGNFNIKNRSIATIKKESLFVWDIIFTNKDIKFYMSVDCDNDDIVVSKAKSIWNRCSFVKMNTLNDDFIKLMNKTNVKNCTTGEMILKTYNFRTLNTGRDNQYPLTNMMSIAKILRDDEYVRVNIAMTPMNRLNWISCAKDEKKKFDNGDILDNEISLKEQLIKYGTDGFEMGFDLWLELKMLPIEAILGIFLDDDLSITAKKNKKTDRRRHRMYEDEDFLETRSLSNYKAVANAFKTKISILSYSKDADRSKVNLIACSNAYKDLNNENELVLLLHSDKEKEKYLDSLRYFDFKIGGKCILCDKEICKLIQLPKKSLQNEYKMKVIETRESEVPKMLQNGKVRICEVDEPSKNMKTVVTFPEDTNLLCRKTVIIGGENSGKTTQEVRFAKDFYKAKISNFVIDHLENGKLTNSITSIMKNEDYMIVDAYNDMPSLSFTEVSKLITEDMDRMLRLDYANMIAKQVELFVNSITDESTGNLTGRMKRFLHSASMIVFIKPRTTINDVFNVLNNYKIRNEFLRYAKYSELFDEDDDVFTDMNELHRRDDKGKILGTRDDLIVGITNRVTIMKQNPRIKEMLKRDYNEELDFEDCIQKGKSIFIKIPQNRFPDADTRDMLAVFYFSRLWLIAQIREENQRSKPCNVMLDEIKTLPVLASFFEKHITEFRRHRMSMTITAHGLQQFGKLLTQLLDAGCNFIIMPPCEKKNLEALKEEMSPFTLEEAMNLKPFHGLCIINYGNQYWKGIGKMFKD